MYISGRNTVGLSLTIPSADIRYNIGKYNNRILEFFNNFFKDLKERIGKESEKSQYPSIINEQKIKEADIAFMYSFNINQIFQKVDELAIILKKQSLFKKEFFDFLEIQQITEYTLKNQEYTKPNIDQIKFVKKLFEEFGDLINYKINLFEGITDPKKIEEKTESKYQQKYTSFQNVLFKYIEQFYLEIYTPSGKHEKTIDNLYAIMKE